MSGARHSNGQIRLKAGRDKSLLRRHPWVFSGGVDHLDGNPVPGDTVAVRAADGRFLAWAAFSPASQLRARVWSFDEDDTIDDVFIANAVTASVERRQWVSARSDAARVVFAESDGLPGVIVDRYRSAAVCELTSAGADRWRDVIGEALLGIDGITSVVERADAPVRRKEGLPIRTGLLAGVDPDPEIEIVERFAAAAPGFAPMELRLGVDVGAGHKTGCYLDQRDNRAVVSQWSHGRRVLDVCCYSGGFAAAAGLGGARSVTAVDSSRPALQMAASNLARNGQTADLVEADAFEELRRRRDLGEQFDLIVLDPPKLAANEREVNRASRAYKDLNLSALRLLAPGGVLATFSCSGSVSEDLFQKIVFGAALDAGRNAQVVQRLGQAGDHPVLLTFPEAQYLKGLLLRVD